MWLGGAMSASAETSRVGTCNPRTSSVWSKSSAIACPILFSSRGKSSGRGATRWYSSYIGVSFMNSAASAFTCPCWARRAGSTASGRR